MHPPTDKAAAEAGGSPRSLTFFWFKYTCACSWLIISTCVALFLCACLTVGGLDYVAQDICARPEVNASDEAACREAFTCFAECNDRYDIVTSARISQCLLANASTANELGLSRGVNCSEQLYHAGSIAYELARHYRNSTLYLTQARSLMTQELQISQRTDGTGRRLAAQPELSGSVRSNLASAVAAAAIGGATGVRPSWEAVGARRALQSDAGLSPRESLAESYANAAVAVSLALIATGRLSVLFGWVAAVAFLAMLPPILGLRGLGNVPPRCCALPSHVERMHKVSMRCACHCSYIWGITILFLGALAATKFQVLARYFTDGSCVDTTGTFCASSAAIPVSKRHAPHQ